MPEQRTGQDAGAKTELDKLVEEDLKKSILDSEDYDRAREIIAKKLLEIQQLKVI